MFPFFFHNRKTDIAENDKGILITTPDLRDAGFYTMVSYWNSWIQDTLASNNLGTANSAPAQVSPPARQCIPDAPRTCYKGGDISKVKATSSSQCCNACLKNPACGAYSYTSKTKSCALKNASGWTASSGSCSSGTVE